MTEQGNLLAEREAFDKLGSLLHRLIGPADDRVEFIASVTSTTNEQHIRIYNPAGQFASSEGRFNDSGGSFEISRAMRELRQASYRTELGTWFGIHAIVTASGSVTMDFNFDDEPQWEIDVNPEVYAKDQSRFPRAAAKQPKWLKQKLDEAAGQ
ncbi:hypothetical protein ACIPWF_09030 [Paenarthrobacter sp. NPDC089989]|uniref:hypothetical protein n=1 Tax=unclassified Paenarthrobacter TaxID=2634190 RepID=UPI0037FBFA02